MSSGFSESKKQSRDVDFHPKPVALETCEEENALSSQCVCVSFHAPLIAQL
jgi:hypothetical protein